MRKYLILFLVILIVIFIFLLATLKEDFNEKPLKFIHITKNAGTYIEDTAKKSNILFGRFHEEYKTRTGHRLWHNIFPNIDEAVKSKYDWFMVVRNPYERILSEYYCEWGGIGRKNMKHNIDQMNNFLIDKIKNRSKEGDHYTEQYKYLDNNYTIHIIKFKNLHEELKKLYSIYNLNIELPNIKINTSKSKNTETKFTIQDFNDELIELINTIYSNDFELFGYNIKIKINIILEKNSDIIYINLDKRKDRKESIINELKHFTSKNPIRLNATYTPSKGFIGCAKSHIRCLEHAIKNNLDRVIIFEDDFIFKRDKKEVYNDITSFINLKNDWDVLLLAGNGQDKNRQKYNDFIDKIKLFGTTSAYIVNKHYLKILLNNFKNAYNNLKQDKAESIYAIDIHWKKLQETDNWYALKKFAGKQRPDYSDIINTKVNYNV